MGTKYGNTPLSYFIIHRISPSAEDGYLYYEYIHPKGLRVIMRATENEAEHLYAVGSFENRVNLDYDTYDKLD